jgi:hypothetical protein
MNRKVLIGGIGNVLLGDDVKIADLAPLRSA